jgi:hypothetical protein
MIFHSSSYIYDKNEKCTKCNIEKNLTEFHKGHSSPETYYSWCKECKNTNSRKNNPKYKETKDKWNKEQRPLYLEKNKEHIKKYSEEYKRSGKLKEQRKIYNEKWKNDPIFKLKNIIYVRINKVLRNKQKSTSRYLGCNFEYLKQHLESQFLPEITWDNYGKIWEIDHKKGLATFDLTSLEEQNKAFHYTNLQPLFKTTAIAESFGYKDQTGNRNKNKYEK